MVKISGDEIRKWRVEIDNAEKFKEEHFGKRFNGKVGAGENIDYFDIGFSQRYLDSARKDYSDVNGVTTINIINPIVKNIIPTLYYKNPNVTVIPKRKEDEGSALLVSHILNYYMDELDIKKTNKQSIFDAYVLGFGVVKIGYTTRFGTNPTDENIKQEKKERDKEKQKGLLEKLGLRRKKEEEIKQNPELDEYIRSESPFIQYINPFNFGIDPAATSIYTARYVYEKVTKLLSDVKKDRSYKNTKDLEGTFIEGADESKIPDTMIDEFKTVDLYEIHYKTDEGINILVLAKDGRDTVALRDDKSVYNMDGFQYELLAFNKHNHRLYPISDVDIIKGLQDRANNTFDNILDQVDKYVPKLGIDETSITEGGKVNLETGDIGAVVYFNGSKSIRESVQELGFTQVKGDLVALIDKIVDVMTIETGLTRAQLTGLTQAQTATEAQIGQAGQNLRISDKLDTVNDFASCQLRKLWQVIQQFVDLEEIELITGEQQYDETTGLSQFSWLPDIDSVMAEKLSKGEYRFGIELGATEKPDLPILRKQLEGLANILMGKGVMEAFQMQGFKINLAELLKRYLQMFPDVFKDIGKIIQPITQQTGGLIPPQGQGQPSGANGATPANMQQLQANPPNTADIISSLGGEKGQYGSIA